MNNLDTPELRKALRSRRRQLTPQQQQDHAHQACQFLMASDLLKGVKRIAVFLTRDGELSTKHLIDQLWEREDLEVYLPALETVPELCMHFARYTPSTKLMLSRFNIPEPDISPSEQLMGSELDLIITPLVGFDLAGNRLGMGGGYYDRTFAFKQHHPTSKPLLVGWAHSCQAVERLDKQPWDIPLNAIVTEEGLSHWN